MLSRCFLDLSVGVRASVIGLSQISSFSLMLISSNLIAQFAASLRAFMYRDASHL